MLRAVARVSMALAMPTIMLIVFLGSNWLDGKFEKQATASQNAMDVQVTRIDRIEKTATTAIDQSAKVNDRLTVVETKQVTADATAAKFQNDTLTRLDRLQDSMVSMSNAIAALTATMQAREDYERRKPPTHPDMLPVSASPFGRRPNRLDADLKIPKFGTGCVLMIALGASSTE